MAFSNTYSALNECLETTRHWLRQPKLLGEWLRIEESCVAKAFRYVLRFANVPAWKEGWNGKRWPNRLYLKKMRSWTLEQQQHDVNTEHFLLLRLFSWSIHRFFAFWSNAGWIGAKCNRSLITKRGVDYCYCVAAHSIFVRWQRCFSWTATVDIERR